MSDVTYKTYTLDQLRQMKDETDWDRLRREEAEGPFTGEDEDDFEVDWASAVLVMPQPKQMISLRIDPDVIGFFKAQGKGYQTRMNAVLRAYMEAAKKAG